MELKAQNLLLFPPAPITPVMLLDSGGDLTPCTPPKRRRGLSPFRSFPS